MSTLILVIATLFLIISTLILAIPSLQRNHINSRHCRMFDEYQQHLLSRLKHRHMLPLIPPPTHIRLPSPVFVCPLYGQIFKFCLSETTNPLYSTLCLKPKLYMDNHWMVRYKLLFVCRSHIKDGSHDRAYLKCVCRKSKMGAI